MKADFSLKTIGKQLKEDNLSLLVIGGLMLFFFWINVSSLLTENERVGGSMPWQQPVLTEASSGGSHFLLTFFLLVFCRAYPLSMQNWQKRLPLYLLASIIYSLLHVSMMVGIRKLFWPILFDAHYIFYGDVIRESLYEYRKDLGTFILSLMVFWSAKKMAGRSEPVKQSVTLRCGSTVIVLTAGDFLFAKSAGNYAEITTNEGQQLARVTLKELEAALKEAGCAAVRVHRSYIVNRAAIREINPVPGGDMLLKLMGGHTLRASRRYREALKSSG